jgi:formamidopyrimidine-DNA glycosylase
MTGRWVERPRTVEKLPYERARLDAGRTSVRYLDLRLFGRLIASADGAPPAEWQALGVDPLVDGIDVEWLATQLAGSRRSIKDVLMDQTVIAGLGNIQAQEALWLAKIDPRRPAHRLDRTRVRKLAEAIRRSIDESLRQTDAPEIVYVEEGGENPFHVYAKSGQPCPRCGRRLERIVQGGRSTVLCSHCQT